MGCTARGRSGIGRLPSRCPPPPAATPLPSAAAHPPSRCPAPQVPPPPRTPVRRTVTFTPQGHDGAAVPPSSAVQTVCGCVRVRECVYHWRGNWLLSAALARRRLVSFVGQHSWASVCRRRGGPLKAWGGPTVLHSHHGDHRDSASRRFKRRTPNAYGNPRREPPQPMPPHPAKNACHHKHHWAYALTKEHEQGRGGEVGSKNTDVSLRQK